jgi:hypothetical protein
MAQAAGHWTKCFAGKTQGFRRTYFRAGVSHLTLFISHNMADSSKLTSIIVVMGMYIRTFWRSMRISPGSLPRKRSLSPMSHTIMPAATIPIPMNMISFPNRSIKMQLETIAGSCRRYLFRAAPINLIHSCTDTICCPPVTKFFRLTIFFCRSSSPGNIT